MAYRAPIKEYTELLRTTIDDGTLTFPVSVGIIDGTQLAWHLPNHDEVQERYGTPIYFVQYRPPQNSPHSTAQPVSLADLKHGDIDRMANQMLKVVCDKPEVRVSEDKQILRQKLDDLLRQNPRLGRSIKESFNLH